MRLLDTDILIDVSRGVPDALATLTSDEAAGPVGVSVITEMELLIGCRNRQEMRAVRAFLSRFTVWQVTPTTSAHAASLVEHFALSHGLRIADALIAATAIEASLPLRSKNQKDYRFLPGLALLPYP